jgi:hypothetical protein
MRIITGTVRDGRVVVEGEPLPEGLRVTVLSTDAKGTFRVSAEEKRMLLESIGQADQGEFVDSDELLRELDEAN